MILKRVIFTILLSSTIFATKAQDTQDKKENPLDFFKPLVNKNWFGQGLWENGSPFFQEFSFEYGLQNTIVITKSKGFINKEMTYYGDRSHGVRQYNTETKHIEFWEFDTFGGLIKGTVEFKDKNIWYHYNYGGTKISDCWQYVDDTTYKLIVGVFKNEKWETIYLQTELKLKK